MQTQANTLPPAEDHEDHSDHYKPLLVAELDRIARECCETEDWYDGQKMALRVFRAAPNPHNAEPARQAFKVLVNAMQGRDDQGEVIDGGVSPAYVSRLRNELLALLGIAQSELFAPEPTPAQQLRDQATAKRKAAVKVIADAKWSDAPGAEQDAQYEAAILERDAAKLEEQAAELEGGAK
jgi:hypothetical protein